MVYLPLSGRYCTVEIIVVNVIDIFILFFEFDACIIIMCCFVCLVSSVTGAGESGKSTIVKQMK